MLRHVLDKTLNKLISRKLMVWLTATGLMLTQTVPLDSSDWVAISLAYIGIEGLADALQMNIGDVQFGENNYNPADATSITPSGTPWTYTDAEGVERSVTWEEYVSAGEAGGSGFDTGTFGDY